MGLQLDMRGFLHVPVRSIVKNCHKRLFDSHRYMLDLIGSFHILHHGNRIECFLWLDYSIAGSLSRKNWLFSFLNLDLALSTILFHQSWQRWLHSIWLRCCICIRKIMLMIHECCLASNRGQIRNRVWSLHQTTSCSIMMIIYWGAALLLGHDCW